jgi:hypothetical protein
MVLPRNAHSIVLIFRVALFVFFLETLSIMESAVLEFWRDYLDSLPPDLDQPKPAGIFSFGDSNPTREE